MIYPIRFQIGPITIYSFGAMMALAALTPEVNLAEILHVLFQVVRLRHVPLFPALVSYGFPSQTSLSRDVYAEGF